jgi:hypothetical protein
VLVNAESKNATKAKEQALAKGDISAISRAVQAMTELSQQNVTSVVSLIRNPSAHIIDFTIKEEKITPTTYEAFITYRIEKDKLINFLADRQIKLKPEARRIAIIRSRDLQGKDVVVERFEDETSFGIDTSKGNQAYPISQSSADKHEANAGLNGAEATQITTVKVKTRSVQEWLEFSPVLSKFFNFNAVFISANLIILEVENIVIDNNLIQTVNENGFELSVLSDKTVVITPKNPADNSDSSISVPDIQKTNKSVD